MNELYFFLIDLITLVLGSLWGYFFPSCVQGSCGTGIEPGLQHARHMLNIGENHYYFEGGEVFPSIALETLGVLISLSSVIRS